MKKIVNGLSLCVFCVSLMSFEVVRAEAKWFGLTHVTLNSTKGAGFVVKPKRVRFGYSWKEGNYFSKLQADLQQADGKKLNINDSSDIVLDAYVGYHFSKTLFVQAGAFSMPVGMDFLTSIKKIDIAERGADAKLVLNRAVGVMLSNSHNFWNSKFSYDVAFAGPASRLSFVESSNKSDNSIAFRFAFDKGGFHWENSAGITRGAYAEGSSNRKFGVINGGASYRWDSWTLKGEATYVYTNATSDDLPSNAEPHRVASFTVIYKFNNKWEGVFKPYVLEHRLASNSDQKLTNIYYGVNYKASKNVSIRANYISVYGKSKDDWSGLGGHKENTAVVLLQYAF